MAGADKSGNEPGGAARGSAEASGADVYRFLFEQNPMPMWVYEAASLRYLDVNQAAIRHFGYSRDEFLTMTIEDIRPLEDVPRLRAMLQDYAAGARSAGHWRLRVKSGAFIDVDIDWLRFELEGRPAVLAVLRDVTEQLHAERALREVEARFQAVAESAPLSMTIKDTEGRFQFCNAEALRVLGLTGKPYLGKTLRDFLGDTASLTEALERQVVATGETLVKEVDMPSGGMFERALLAQFPIRDTNSRIVAVGAFGIDVTKQKRAEAALQSSEERFASVVDMIEEAIWIHDAGTISFANPAGARLFGTHNPAAVIGRTLASFLHAEDRPRVEGRIQFLLREKTPLPPTMVRFIGLDRVERIAEVQAAPLRQNGKLLIVSSGRDVTGRTRIEASLRDIEARFEALVQNAPIAINIRDVGGRYRYLNAEAERVMGIDSGSCLGKTAREVVDADTAAAAEADDSKVIESGVTQVMETNLPSRIPYESTLMVRVPMRNATGAVIAVGSFAIDVTRQKRAETALAESESRRRATEQRFERIVELVQEAIWIHDQGTINFSNPAAAQLFGTSDPEQLIGRSVFEFMHPEDAKRARDRTAKMTRDGQALTPTEMRIIGFDGKTRIAELQAVPFRQDGQLLGIASGRDVTAQRDAETRLLQVQKMEAVGQLTGGIAHDFNNLLTIIIGALDQDLSKLPPDVARWLEQAMRAAERGAALTHRLLAFSRRQALNAGPVELNRLVAGMDDLLRRTLGEQVEVDLVLSADLWAALADAAQVENALLNLTINARDAMPSGGTVTVETANAQFDADYAAANPGLAPGDYVMLAVSDTGTGMPPEVLQRAFEPFFTTKEVGKGTGLGLAMIYGFARQSRGHVVIYSEVGQGTTVRLYLPRLEVAIAPTPEAAAPHAAGGGEIILVVEDDTNVRKLVVRQLTDLGYQVLEAAHGKAALEIIDSGKPIDLLFTDVVMPGGMNGRQLAEAAHERRPGLKALFTSGYTADTVLRHGTLDAGTKLLSKPYRKRDLALKIREALEGR